MHQLLLRTVGQQSGNGQRGAHWVADDGHARLRAASPARQTPVVVSHCPTARQPAVQSWAEPRPVLGRRADLGRRLRQCVGRTLRDRPSYATISPHVAQAASRAVIESIACEYRALGKTGCDVSRLGLGAMGARAWGNRPALARHHPRALDAASTSSTRDVYAFGEAKRSSAPRCKPRADVVLATNFTPMGEDQNRAAIRGAGS